MSKEWAGTFGRRQPSEKQRTRLVVVEAEACGPGADGTDSVPGGVLVGEVVAPGMCTPEVWKNCTVVSKLQ